jgi:hypothetical protein
MKKHKMNRGEGKSSRLTLIRETIKDLNDPAFLELVEGGGGQIIRTSMDACSTETRC